MDLGRMLVGDFSWGFTLEIVLRTCAMYLYTLGVIRLLGKRGMGHLSPFESVIIVALGSAVGDPMFYADVPLLHGFVVITVIVSLQRLLELATQRSTETARLLEGTVRTLVVDGELVVAALEEERLTETELFSALREHEIEQLGEVRRAYLEPSGTVTVFRADEPTEGRSVLPDH